MRVDLGSLDARLGFDLGSANRACDAAYAHEVALLDAAGDRSMGTSASLDSYRSFLTDVRVPAARLHQDALLALVADMQADRGRAGERAAELGSVVDTNELQHQVDRMMRSATRLDELSHDQLVDAQASSAMREAARGLRGQACAIQDKLDRLMAYLHDGSVYAGSLSYTQSLAASQRAIDAVSVDPTTGRYSLAGIDMSWVPVMDEAYWRERNRLVLGRYVELGPDGGIVGLRPEMTMRYLALLGIAALCLLGPGLPAEVDELTSDERYVLLWILDRYPEAVLAAESEAAATVSDELGINPAGPALGVMSFLGGLPISAAKPLLSFDVDDGVFHSTDQPFSVQHRNGFCDAIDLAGPLLGMDLETCVTTFTYGGKEWRIQPWDGSYGAGLAYGGEVGVYCRDHPGTGPSGYEHRSAEYLHESIDVLDRDAVNDAFTVFEPVTGDQRPEMMVTVRTGDPRYSVSREAGRTYWNYIAKEMPLDDDGLRIEEAKNEYLSVQATLDFSDDPGLARAAEQALRADGVTVSREGSTLHVLWCYEDMD